MLVTSLIAALMQPSSSPAPADLFLRAPAGFEYAKVVPGGVTVLPNGRYVTPKGKRFYGSANVWRTLAHPDGKSLLMIQEGGYAVYDDLNLERTKPRNFAIKGVISAGALTASGEQLILSLGDRGALGIFEALTGKLISEIRVNADGASLSHINDLALTKDGKYAVAVDVANQDLLVIDLVQAKLISRTKAGRQPYAVALSDDDSKVFVANIGLLNYSVVPKPEGTVGDKGGLELPPFPFPSKESEKGAFVEGRFVPGLGSPYSPDAESVFMYDLKNPAKPKKVKDVQPGVLIHAPSDGGKAVGGSQPNSLLVRGNMLYVACGNSDMVQAYDTRTMKLVFTSKLVPFAPLAKMRGVMPSGMTLSKDGNTLFVCESGINSVAALDAKTGKVGYRIPTGWFPTHVALGTTGKQLCIATQKGLGRGPRGAGTGRTPDDERFGFTDMPGMVSVTDLPQDSATRKAWTQEVLVNNGMVNRLDEGKQRPASPIPLLPGKPSEQIKHVVFITKENHTFDGIFGGLKGAKGKPEFAQFGMDGWIAEKGKDVRLPIMPNHIKLAEQFSISDNFYMEPEASGDGHRWLVGVYPSIWTTKVFYSGWDFMLSNTARGRLTSFGSNGSQIPEDYLENGSMWEHLDRGGVSIRNYGEGFEFAGQDEPKNPPRSGSILSVNFPMSKVLWDNTCWDFPVYNNDIPDIARVEWFKEDIENNYRKKKKPIPKFMNITLCNDHGAGAKPKEGYPYVCSYMADNDLALGQTLEYLSQQPEWKNMAVFVTQDDSGGDDDHVDRHRSFVLALGPWAKKGYVSSEHTSIMSILKTIYLIFGLGPNNQFDALATDLRDMFTMTPDYSPYKTVDVDPRVFVAKDAYDPKDPKFKDRRYLKPSIKMDDPAFVESLRKLGSGN